MNVMRFQIPPENEERIDKIIASLCDGITRSAAQRLLENGCVLLSGRTVLKSCIPKPGETLEVCIPEPEKTGTEAENIPLEIAYEDGDLLVVNKPKGMVVHPAAGNYTGTLVNALLYYCGDSLSGINGEIRPGIVHRIDKDTSGLLIVAKNDFAHQGLAKQIRDHSFTRIYEAIVQGNLREDRVTVDAPIGRHPVMRKKMAIVLKNGREARTHYEVLHRFPGYTYVSLKLETGRTHQIRVHMSSLGHPVAGDVLYGAKKESGFTGQCLHARIIGFIHPRTGQYMEFSSELPQYFIDFLDTLKKKEGKTFA